MTPERWERVQQLYHECRAQTGNDFERFLAEACAGDDALHREVQALLDQPVETSSFVDFLGGPAPPHLANATLRLTGRRFASYQVSSLLGRGGMGEVYRAHDTKLGRDVAIKVLPPMFTADPERLARFDSEARMLAALNHPHIGAIYGVEDADDVPALVLEFVDGETLAERIRRGPLSSRDALAIARQVADALDAAHDKGIVHRDLKPANIKITPAGRDYDSQPGTDPGFPRTYEQNKFLGKLTWQATPTIRVLSSFHNEEWVNPERPTLTSQFETTLRFEASVPTTTFAHVTHTPTNDTLWEARVGRFVSAQENIPNIGNVTTANRLDRITGASCLARCPVEASDDSSCS